MAGQKGSYKQTTPGSPQDLSSDQTCCEGLSVNQEYSLDNFTFQHLKAVARQRGTTSELLAAEIIKSHLSSLSNSGMHAQSCNPIAIRAGSNQQLRITDPSDLITIEEDFADLNS